MTETSYTAKDITVLEGLEPVRLRPGMYIGSTGQRGLHHLVYEVVDNSVDEALAGRNERIEITLHPDNSVTVRDFGSGIPVDVMAEQGLPALDGRPDEAPRGREVRRRRLQGVRRPARRRRLRRERALRVRSSPRCAATGRSTARSSRAAPRSPRWRSSARRRRTTRARSITLPARRGDLRGDSSSRRRPHAALPRDRLPDARPAHRLRGRARGRGAPGVLRRGRHPRLRRLRERREGHRAQARRLPRGRDRRGHRRGGDAVEHLLRRVGLLVREQHQHARGRHAPLRLQGRAHRHAQQVRPRQGRSSRRRTRTSRARTSARGSPRSSR